MYLYTQLMELSGIFHKTVYAVLIENFMNCIFKHTEITNIQVNNQIIPDIAKCSDISLKAVCIPVWFQFIFIEEII